MDAAFSYRCDMLLSVLAIVAVWFTSEPGADCDGGLVLAIRCVTCGLDRPANLDGTPCPNCGGTHYELVQIASTVLRAKEQVARDLANRHFAIEPGMTRIFRYCDEEHPEESRAEPLKLLEVNVATVPVGIMPLGFGPIPSVGIPFPSTIIEVTPDEFDSIEKKNLTLPDGWTRRVEIQRTKPD